MTPEPKRVASQIRRSHEGEAWHGPSLMEALEGVDCGIAASRPAASSHSIWELVKHVAAWQAMALFAVEGGEYESMSGDADWPPVTDTSAEAWVADLAAITEINAKLVAVVRSFPEARLDELVAGQRFNFYFLLQGIVQHNVYHAGQIVLLKRIAAGVPVAPVSWF